ncbi:glycosyltransferase involved in cell wall biosynthesis [Gillisia mitskevichiae]|uniref:Glycosyltransferase involved in cell wall biosynthesis n=1 Tax=Gillisia mitskevichiae TaxID=270921 RepID=A0A495PIR0_9FLAO|nr:glycosyltransferase family 4 protein [Gillisia mitskevichiae]RKS50573.1 glycosyltransferase involved in cell wall biosynthesis [Gillisia mitskevichiae]
MPKLVRITTIPLSLEKLLEGQLSFMNSHYEVTAIAAEKERLEKYGRDNAVKTFWVNMTRKITPTDDLKAVFKLYKYFKKEKPLIVHTHTPKAGIVGMFAAKLAGVPIRLHTVAGLPLLETTGNRRKVLNFVEKLTYFFATKIYPNSFELKNIILDQGFTSDKKLKILGKGSSNGIDTKYFDPSLYSEAKNENLKKELKIKDKDLVFIFIGRIVSEKGINELITAFTKLYEVNSKLKLLLVGPFESDLDPIEDSNLEIINSHQGIITVGYQEDVRPYLAISDVLTFPSYREGFPNVVMQAGAMNLPSIVTDINGCNEIITNNLNGLIIPVKDSVSLYNAMNKLQNDRFFLEEMKSNTRSHITTNYEREQFWNLLLAEYKELEEQYS